MKQFSQLQAKNLKQASSEQHLGEREKRLRARYGHVSRGGGDENQIQYQLHLKVDERKVSKLIQALDF